MTRPAETSTFDRLISPPALFLGVGLSFLACCGAGFWASRHDCLENFQRFHVFLSPETLYYPTVNQVRQLVKGRVGPGQIAVVVGGSSILHGTGQTEAQLWTRKLQALLGGRYRVINLGMRSARTAEFGGVAAEVLSRDLKKLIFVSDLHPEGMYGEPDGTYYRYFFWDAHARGLLVPHRRREERLRPWAGKVEETEPGPGTGVASREELQFQMGLDRGCYFNDLWTTLAYTHLVTVWTPLTRECFSRPRRRYADPEAGPGPPATRFATDFDRSMAQLRGQFAGRCVKDAAGKWVEDPRPGTWARFDRVAREHFPPSVRRRTLLLVVWNSAYHVNRLSADERSCYAAVSRLAVGRLKKLGFAALEVGKNYSPADYADYQHLTEAGGARMAAAVAPRVRALARRLGYTP
jgi:hypothetical protein